MHSNTTQQRKNKPKNITREDPSAIQTTTSLVGSTSTTYKKNDDAQEVSLSLNQHDASSNNTSKSSPTSAHSKEKKSGRSKAPLVATVRRNMFGTSPFDKYWLNLGMYFLFISISTMIDEKHCLLPSGLSLMILFVLFEHRLLWSILCYFHVHAPPLWLLCGVYNTDPTMVHIYSKFDKF